MKQRPVRHRLEYALYVGMKSLILALPHRGVRVLGRAVGHLHFAVDPKRRRLMLENMAKTLPQIGEQERYRQARECFAHFGAVFFEAVSVARFDAEGLRRSFDVEGWEHIEEAQAAGKGVFFMSGHYGNWELAIYPLVLGLGGLDMIARPPNNPWVSRDVARIRQRFGGHILPRKRVGHTMLNILRKGGHIALAIDQRVMPHHGILVPFLGQPAWTTRWWRRSVCTPVLRWSPASVSPSNGDATASPSIHRSGPRGGAPQPRPR